MLKHILKNMNHLPETYIRNKFKNNCTDLSAMHFLHDT